MTQHSRRDFLKQLSAMSSMGAAGTLGVSLGALTNAAAQTAPADYRALVCIFMFGGNDAFNTVLATDSTSWAHYLNHRDPKVRNPQDTTSTSIALLAPGVTPNASAAGSTPERLGGVLPITHVQRAPHTTRSFALHPALTDVQRMYTEGRVAVLANVGPLLAPTLKADWYDSKVTKPAKLFSHNDQQSTWQSFGTEGTTEGWAGHMGDVLRTLNGTGHASASLIQRSFTCMTPNGSSVWLGGANVLPFQTGSAGLSGLGSGNNTYGSAKLQTALTNIMSNAASNSDFVKDHQDLVKRSIQANTLIGSTLPSFALAPWGTATTTNVFNEPKLKYTSPVDGSSKFNNLALQLQMVARLIDTNRAAGLGIKRQFFMVGFGGFDTHDKQIPTHAEAMAQLNHAMKFFDDTLKAMPVSGDMRSQVTTFTASDFGRSFTNNGDGTDHGWGAHHFIMGGAVNGTEVYGSFPEYSTADTKGVFASKDQIQNGVLLPTTSVDHYAYTLGRWMGVPDATLSNGILPNLTNFPSAGRDLGFMKT